MNSSGEISKRMLVAIGERSTLLLDFPLAGPIGDTDTVDWGLPFFYGRRVFIGVDGPAITPFYAF